MMRMKLIALAAAAVLALPMTASAFGRKGCSNCGGAGNGGGLLSGLGGNCGNGGTGKWAGKWEGKWDKHHNAAPDYGSGKQGKGFLQPPFQAAPWYLYWPYDAHFQLPAPIGAPYYPPQNLHTPWNPYFAHPALGLAGGPPPYPGFSAGPGAGTAPATGGFAPRSYGD